jgi:signal transduction histidine kinase
MHAPVKILIVEDNDGLRDHVAQILQMEQYAVVTAADGEAGLALAAVTQPDLVLCDVMMPRMDGHQMLQALRETESGSAVPFVFLTAKADRSDVRTGMGLGADDYLTKPFGADELLDTIRSRLVKHRVLAGRTSSLMRSESLSLLSHEVRTPLNGIIGLADLMLNEPALFDEAQRSEAMRELRDSGVRLGHTLTNLMLYLDLESARHSDSRARTFTQGGPTVIGHAIQSATERKSRHWNRGSQITVAHDVGLTRMPGPLLEKALEEIVDNAFRFSKPETAIRLNAVAEGNWISISIEDRGVGMTTEQIATQQPFRQHDRDRNEQQGLGLGLAVARRLVEINHGRLQIAPGREGGTVVTLWLRRLTVRPQSDEGARSARSNPSR